MNNISLISYLNSLPLIAFFENMPQKIINVFYDIPSECCRKLISREVDAGLVSSVIIPENQELNIVDGVCVSSPGPVESVLLLSRKPLNQIDTVGLDPASRTSNILIQILFDRWIQKQAAFKMNTQSIEDGLKHFDAVLAIGDRAFEFGAENPSSICFDLAMEWKHFTGLPFVFAVWGIQKDSTLDPDIFRKAMKYGLDHLEEITDHYAADNSLQPFGRKLVYKYLTENLHYDFGSKERKSLHLFYKYAHDLGLIKGNRDINFV